MSRKLPEALSLKRVCFDDMTAYIKRGRRHERWPLDELRRVWDDAAHAFLVRGHDYRRDDYLDVRAEYAMRGLPEPIPGVPDGQRFRPLEPEDDDRE